MKAGRYEHVLSFAVSHPWAVMPEMMPVIAGILARHIAGLDSGAEIAAALVNRKNLPQPRAGSVAVIPVYGVIAPRMNMFSEISGGTTFEKLSGQLRAAVGDKSIKTIVLDVDSPGGSVAGGTEFVAELLRARTKKPIIAVAQYLMGSAAYAIGAAATELVASPSARVGSVGAYWMHDDLSAQLALLGIKRTFVSAGDGKLDGNEAGPLSDEATVRRQATIDDAYRQFVNNVVKGRGQGMTPERVRNEWKAFVYGSADAKSIGMIDTIATLDETITRVLSASPDAADQRAALAHDFDFSTSTTAATLQEPSPATSQEPPSDSDAQWRNRIEGGLLELDL